MTQLRTIMLTMKSTAVMSATKVRICRAGRTALASVYFMPVKPWTRASLLIMSP